MNDVLPADTANWRRMLDAVQVVMDSYGYQEIKLPIIEATELFKRAVGEVTDVVEKEMFTFTDNEKTSMSLRPEGTAGCVRAGIDHGLLHNQQQRLWYYGPMFRHERPQAGRYRQFHQVGVEAYGTIGPTTDIEVIALCARLWKQLGLLDLKLELNSLGSAESRMRYRDVLMDFLRRNESALDEDSRRRMNTNPLRVLDSKHPQTREVLRAAPQMADSLERKCREHFAAVQAGLDALKIPYVLNPRLVRGLDYYTRTVFEWTTDQLGAQGTVCAGGRYDGLVAQLGGGDVPAVGFALGVERLILLLDKQGVRAPLAVPHVYFCWLGRQHRGLAMRCAEELRDAGLRVMLNAVAQDDLKKQFKRADKSGARIALVIGDDEAAAGIVQVKFLREDRPQAAVARSELSEVLAGLIPRIHS